MRRLVVAMAVGVAHRHALLVSGHGVSPMRGRIEQFAGADVKPQLDLHTTLVAKPSVLQRSGDQVTVCVTSSITPTQRDFIAAFAPADADINKTAPVKLKYLAPSSSSLYPSTGDGCVWFDLLNIRDNYSFALFTGDVDAPALITRTEAPVTFSIGALEPTGLHMALTGVRGELRVTWTAGTAGTAVPTQPVIEWSKGTVNASTDTYTVHDMCGAPATTVGWHDPGLIHSGVMGGVQTGEGYRYRVGDAGSGIFSEWRNFAGPPFGGDVDGDDDAEEREWALAVFGDMGTAEEDLSIDSGHWEEPASLNTSRLLSLALEGTLGEHPPIAMVMHIGDLSYARGYDFQWDEFLHQIEPIASRVPWMVGVGNHERDFPSNSKSGARTRLSRYHGEDSGGECGVSTQVRFPMPGPMLKSGDDSPWYSVEAGPVHFVVMSTEHSYTAGSDQYVFLQHDLANNVDRSRTPWVVLCGHRPMYIDSDFAGPDDSDMSVSKEMRGALESLLLEHKVDLCVYGHHHSYQRTCQVLNGECLAPSSDPEYHAPVHVVVGMAGQGLSQNLQKNMPIYMEAVDAWHYGLSIMTVTRRYLRVALFNDDDARLLDAFTITVKDHGSHAR